MLAERAEALHAELSGLAVATRRYPPQDAGLSGRTETMVLNAAYLVDEGGAARLRAVVERSAEGLQVTATGPWAAYSFAEPEPEAGR